MLFAAVSTLLALIFDLLHAMTRGEHDKTLEIVVLRQQLRRYERTASARPRLSRWDKLVLATIVAKYRALASGLVLVQPATVLRWHRAIVRRKWTYGSTPKRGRPTIAADTVELIVRLARENRAWATASSRASCSRWATACRRPRSGGSCDGRACRPR